MFKPSASTIVPAITKRAILLICPAWLSRLSRPTTYNAHGGIAQLRKSSEINVNNSSEAINPYDFIFSENIATPMSTDERRVSNIPTSCKDEPYHSWCPSFHTPDLRSSFIAITQFIILHNFI